ncbi:MAG: DNA repair protein RecO [Anaerolineales bacterium]|nr:DNA repair protein RecO [Anaerolineales bacterium]
MPSRERSIKIEAIVLRHNNWGEADRLISLYTQSMGKVRAIGKGVRKLQSRKAGHLEPFTRVQLLLAHGRDMYIITQAETLDAFQPLRESLERLGYAAYIIELLDQFTYEEGENQALYHLLSDTLSRLCTFPNPALVVRYYEIRMLDLLGFRPQLFQCVRCHADIQAEDQFISAELGGALCPKCGQTTPGAQPISMTALKYLRHFQRSNFQEAARVSLSAGINREMETLIEHYLTYHLEHALKSPSVIRRMRNKQQAK